MKCEKNNITKVLKCSPKTDGGTKFLIIFCFKEEISVNI